MFLATFLSHQSPRTKNHRIKARPRPRVRPQRKHKGKKVRFSGRAGNSLLLDTITSNLCPCRGIGPKPLLPTTTTFPNIDYMTKDTFTVTTDSTFGSAAVLINPSFYAANLSDLPFLVKYTGALSFYSSGVLGTGASPQVVATWNTVGGPVTNIATTTGNNFAAIRLGGCVITVDFVGDTLYDGGIMVMQMTYGFNPGATTLSGNTIPQTSDQYAPIREAVRISGKQHIIVVPPFDESYTLYHPAYTSDVNIYPVGEQAWPTVTLWFNTTHTNTSIAHITIRRSLNLIPAPNNADVYLDDPVMPDTAWEEAVCEGTKAGHHAVFGKNCLFSAPTGASEWDGWSTIRSIIGTSLATPHGRQAAAYALNGIYGRLAGTRHFNAEFPPLPGAAMPALHDIERGYRAPVASPATASDLPIPEDGDHSSETAPTGEFRDWSKIFNNNLINRRSIMRK